MGGRTKRSIGGVEKKEGVYGGEAERGEGEEMGYVKGAGREKEE